MLYRFTSCTSKNDDFIFANKNAQHYIMSNQKLCTQLIVQFNMISYFIK